MRVLSQLEVDSLFAAARTTRRNLLLSVATGHLKAADRAVKEQRRLVARGRARLQGEKPKWDQRDPEKPQACSHSRILCGDEHCGNHRNSAGFNKPAESCE